MVIKYQRTFSESGEQKNIPNQERIEDCLKKIKLSSKHLRGLINDILDMSKIESGKMTLNMNQVSRIFWHNGYQIPADIFRKRRTIRLSLGTINI